MYPRFGPRSYLDILLNKPRVLGAHLNHRQNDVGSPKDRVVGSRGFSSLL